VERAKVDAVEKSGEGDRVEDDEGDEGGAVSVVEAVAGFEVGGRDARFRDARFERRGVGEAGVQQAVGGVNHPDGEEHGGWLGPGEMEVRAAGDEDGPEGGYGGGVEGEEMP
jgi:hypothetical protein